MTKQPKIEVRLTGEAISDVVREAVSEVAAQSGNSDLWQKMPEFETDVRNHLSTLDGSETLQFAVQKALAGLAWEIVDHAAAEIAKSKEDHPAGSGLPAQGHWSETHLWNGEQKAPEPPVDTAKGDQSWQEQANRVADALETLFGITPKNLPEEKPAAEKTSPFADPTEKDKHEWDSLGRLSGALSSAKDRGEAWLGEHADLSTVKKINLDRARTLGERLAGQGERLTGQVEHIIGHTCGNLRLGDLVPPFAPSTDKNNAEDDHKNEVPAATALLNDLLFNGFDPSKAPKPSVTPAIELSRQEIYDALSSVSNNQFADGEFNLDTANRHRMIHSIINPLTDAVIWVFSTKLTHTSPENRGKLFFENFDSAERLAEHVLDLLDKPLWILDYKVQAVQPLGHQKVRIGLYLNAVQAYRKVARDNAVLGTQLVEYTLTRQDPITGGPSSFSISSGVI